MKEQLSEKEVSVYLAFLVNLFFIAALVFFLPGDRQFYSFRGKSSPGATLDLDLNGYKRQVKADPNGDFVFDRVPVYSQENRLQLDLAAGGGEARQTVLYEHLHGSNISLSHLLILLFIFNSMVLLHRVLSRPAPLTTGLKLADHRRFQGFLATFLKQRERPENPEGFEGHILDSLGQSLDFQSFLYLSWNKLSERYDIAYSRGEIHHVFKDGLVYLENRKIRIKNSHLDLSETLFDADSQAGNQLFQLKKFNLKCLVFPAFRDDFPRRILVLLEAPARSRQADACQMVENSLELLSRTVEFFNFSRGRAEMDLIDTVTGIYLHRHFQPVLNREIERSERQNQQLVLALITIDHFEKIRKGAQQERCLAAVAEILRQAIRPYDTLCRYREESTFAMLLSAASDQDARAILERIRKNIETNLSAKLATRHQLTLSAGVGCYPRDATLAQTLLEKVEATAHAAAEKGNVIFTYATLYEEEKGATKGDPPA